MRTIKRICNNCDIEFLADPREVNRGNAKYCNLSCAMKNQTINQPLVLKKCEICNEDYETKSKNSKFCSVNCKLKNYREKQKVNGISLKTIKRIFNNLGCEICSWNETICDLHHVISVKDGGKNDIKNLIMVCPNHHRIIHMGKIKNDILINIILNRKPLTYKGRAY